jgi:hypothetical protein
MGRPVLRALVATLALDGCSPHSEPNGPATAAPDASTNSVAPASAPPTPEASAVTAGERPFDAYVPIATM